MLVTDITLFERDVFRNKALVGALTAKQLKATRPFIFEAHKMVWDTFIVC